VYRIPKRPRIDAHFAAQGGCVFFEVAMFRTVQDKARFHADTVLRRIDKDQVAKELKQAHLAIEGATGQRPVGFRGPGYAHSAATLEVVKELGYDFDASILPSIIGPLARLYYFWSSGLNRKERHTRRGLFGSLGDGMLPLRPFEWLTPAGGLLEIPVTTIPLLRIPFHPSYILWISRRTRWIAANYMRNGLRMCRLCGVGPSVILHPLDFLGKGDVSGLSFFPGMDLPRQHKLEVVGLYLDEMQRRFDVVPLSEHARRIRASSASLKSVRTD